MAVRRGSMDGAIRAIDHGTSSATRISALLSLDFPPWFEDAVCSQTDPELFFPEKGGGTGRAKWVCKNKCDVREQCLNYALDNNERFGVWGGMTERERRKALRLRDGAA